MKYLCDVCKVYEYDDAKGDAKLKVKKGKKPKDFPKSWKCPICKADKTHLKAKKSKTKVSKTNLDYLSSWKKDSSDVEDYMNDIHEVAIKGESITEPMRTKKKVISWDEILIKGAQLAKIPLNAKEKVNTQTIIGKKSKHPLVLETPIYITHMSFGALSKEAKLALSKGSAKAKTAMCSGEGGMLEESRKNAYKYIFEYVPNEYSVTKQNLKKVDAIEIKIGQSTKPGMGGHLPGAKVTKEIAKVRGVKAGEDVTSPANFKDIKNKKGLKKKVKWLRKESGGKPIGIKIAAGHIEEDLEVALYAKPDFITIDGRPGATAASGKVVKSACSIPTLFSLYRARKYLDKKNKKVSLVITGGFRSSADIAKALAMGADAVAVGTAALMALGCQQYRICNSGNCPVGITTQDSKLRKRLNVNLSAQRVENFLNVYTKELKDFARLTGNNDVHSLSINDLCTVNSEISNHTEIKHV
jgi:methylamine---glutamate N-methyltransferase subunit C